MTTTAEVTRTQDLRYHRTVERETYTREELTWGRTKCKVCVFSESRMTRQAMNSRWKHGHGRLYLVRNRVFKCVCVQFVMLLTVTSCLFEESIDRDRRNNTVPLVVEKTELKRHFEDEIESRQQEARGIENNVRTNSKSTVRLPLNLDEDCTHEDI